MTPRSTTRKSPLSAFVPALAGVAAVAAAVAPPPASAHDTYVDHSDGSNDSAQCLRADPCATIGRALLKADRGDTVFVGGDPVAFTTPVKLRAGMSLIHRDFSTDPAIDTSGGAKIDTGSDPRPAITVTSEAGKINDLFINSETTSLEIHAAVKVSKNKFLNAAGMTGPVIDIAPDARGNAVIKANSLHGPTPPPAGTQIGIRNRSRTAPLIAGNALSVFTTAIWTKGRPTIRDNGIFGTHTGGGLHGEGILVHGGTATLSGNALHSPNTSGAGVTGIDIQEADAHLIGNWVFDYDTGISLEDTRHPVDLTGDLIRTSTDVSSTALAAVDNTDSPGVSDPHATTVTMVGTGKKLSLDSVRMRLDSSIVGNSTNSVQSLSGGTICKITRSRGPFTGSTADGCTSYQTTKDPLFAADGYHLTAASPLIDKGSKRATPPNAKDIDGDRRALDGPDGGDCDGPARRDIGVDEFAC